ncbi:MAG: MurT ligase domain-containing protein [Patescibacteria group bacterium]
MINRSLIISGKALSQSFRLLNLGNGTTWPGHIALSVNKNFTKDLLKDSPIKLIFIAGTNGKTTTATLIKNALEKAGKKVIQNESGANLLNGIASTLLLSTNASGKLTQDYAIFEVDENVLPKLLQEVTPEYLILMNLFRDQLDRYGEIDSIAKKWQEAIQKLTEKTQLIVNADDPQIAYLGLRKNPVIPDVIGDPEKIEHDTILYFGLESQENKQELQHAADSVYCPQCGMKLTFTSLIFSHLGHWQCKACGLKRPQVEKASINHYPLPGAYNKYNTLAAWITLQRIGLTNKEIEQSLRDFQPAFGRQEIIEYKNKNVQIFLSKNPTSFNQSYMTMKELEAKTLLLVLNDRIPDGRDVSWIWDIDLPDLTSFKNVLISGDRVYDMALRIKYEGYKEFETFENLTDAIERGISLTQKEETFFVLPTYSAMLEVRKILTGKKIL